MSIQNPTNRSAKRLSQFVEAQDLPGLVEWLEVQVEPLSEAHGLIWLRAIEKGWWSGANVLEKSIEDFKTVVANWKTNDGNTAWHWVAASRGEWEARNFLTDFPIVLAKNEEGRYPFWNWTSPIWAETWVRLMPPSQWLSAREDRDANGIHPVTFWLDQNRWALAFWFVQQGHEKAKSAERTKWSEILNEAAPEEWRKSWKSLGI